MQTWWRNGVANLRQKCNLACLVRARAWACMVCMKPALRYQLWSITTHSILGQIEWFKVQWEALMGDYKMLFLIFQIEAWITRNWFHKMACQVFDEITRMACPREVILALSIFSNFKLLLEQVILKFTISHDPKMNLGIEYQKRMLILMVDQKST